MGWALGMAERGVELGCAWGWVDWGEESGGRTGEWDVRYGKGALGNQF